jgi:hypothetical protein
VAAGGSLVNMSVCWFGLVVGECMLSSLACSLVAEVCDHAGLPALRMKRNMQAVVLLVHLGSINAKGATA